MDITPNVPAGRQIVERYGGGGFLVSGHRYEGSVIILPEQTISWSPRFPSEIMPGSFEPLEPTAAELDILLIGCGATGMFLSRTLREHLRGFGLVADAMATGAAARTYNVLMSEGRRAAAALIALD